MPEFIIEDFLLQTKTAKILYHEHAKQMPIYDYHCHLPADLIASDHRFDNLTQAWLAGPWYFSPAAGCPQLRAAISYPCP